MCRGQAGDSADMSKAERIFQLAQEGADSYHIFKLRRAGAGTHFVNEVINHLKSNVIREVGAEVVTQFLGKKEDGQPVDFWLEDEQTVMEIEFDILSSPPVLEKEIFKALLAKDAGNNVQYLILIGDPGSVLLSQTPRSKSIIAWVEQHHQIRVQIWELIDKG